MTIRRCKEEMARWNAKLLMTSPMPQYNLSSAPASRGMSWPI